MTIISGVNHIEIIITIHQVLTLYITPTFQRCSFKYRILGVGIDKTHHVSRHFLSLGNRNGNYGLDKFLHSLSRTIIPFQVISLYAHDIRHTLTVLVIKHKTNFLNGIFGIRTGFILVIPGKRPIGRSATWIAQCHLEEAHLINSSNRTVVGQIV